MHLVSELLDGLLLQPLLPRHHDRLQASPLPAQQLNWIYRWGTGLLVGFICDQLTGLGFCGN